MISSTNLFQPVHSVEKSEEIRLQIESAIVAKKLLPGDRLPSERNLQGLFGTSRGAVREALRSLRQKGLLEAKKGAKGGYYVKELDINDAIDHLAVMIKQQQIPLGKLLEFQHSMDQAVLVSAVSNGSPIEIEKLLELTDVLVQLCREESPDLEKISDIDKQLNLMVVKMTQNPFFEWMMRSVQLTFRSYEFIVYEEPDYRREIAENWRSVAAAIGKRDLQRALGLYGHWYVMLEKCLLEKFGDAVFTNQSRPEALHDKGIDN